MGLNIGSKNPLFSQRAFNAIRDLLPKKVQIKQLIYEKDYFYLLNPEVFAKNEDRKPIKEFIHSQKNLPDIFKRNSSYNRTLVTEEFRQRILQGKFIGVDFRLEYSDEEQP